MMTPDDVYEWLPVREAADRLNTSASTVLRMIREGSLVAELGPRSERDKRPQYLVRFDRPQETPVSTPDATTTRQDTPELTMRALEILDTLLRANGETMERQAETIAQLRERAARAESDARHANIEADRLRADLERARRPWWRFW